MAFVAVTKPIVLPWPLQSRLEAMARVLLEPGDRSHIDFSRPDGHGLHPWEAEVVRLAGALADRLVLASNPAVQACRRIRLPADYLYVHRSALA